MSLSRKFIITILVSISLVAIINIVAFYFFYNSYFKLYLEEKQNVKKEITIDYINKLVEKQTEDEIDNIFSDTEMNFFELLEDNKWKIPLNKKENIDTVINYLVKNKISPKYIQDLLPDNNLTKVIQNFKDPNSLEYKFITRLTNSILIINIIILVILSIAIWFFIKKTIFPIKEITKKIKKLKPWKEDQIIKYNKKDEIWLLVSSINWLNKRLNLQKQIRSRLLADISHELKTPITSISCYLEWIADWVIKLDNKNLSAITEEMQRLISLVNRIMNYEKFENQKLDLEKKEYIVADILKQVVETHKKNLKTNKQKIKIVWDEYLTKVFDKNLFKQIIHNLIWNFLKYSWKNTTLTINVTKTYVDFKDNWHWVKASEIPFLTEKFYQAQKEKTWDATKRWIWVWLSLVAKIIEKHKWSFEIKSDIWKWYSFKIFY